MNLEELIRICINEKKIICLVGAGGKTTLMYKLATEAASKGKKVIVSTTTHIMCPKNNYAVDMEGIRRLWCNREYAAIGMTDSAAPEKLVFPERELYESAKKEADLIILEADGAKRFPCKVPAEYEPVIEEECNLIVGVMGMSALGHSLRDCCFRFSEEGKWLGIDEDTKLNEDIAIRILTSDKGTKKCVNNRDYVIVLNQCDDEIKMKCAQAMVKVLDEKYNIKAVCCCLK